MDTKEKIREVNGQIYSIQESAKKELDNLKETRYEPLLKVAEDELQKIKKEVNGKYRESLEALVKQRNELQVVADGENIAEAANKWYAAGTKVWRWKYPKYWSSNRKPEVSDETGIVHIYDGTQALSKTKPMMDKTPEKGDVIIILNKKDGTPGIQYNNLSNWHGEISNHYWFPEGVTPDTCKFNNQPEED